MAGYQVLARKYRPLRFSDVVGQDHVTRTLLNALSQNRIAHGYIFSGHRGIGKTTIARILASALNCRNEIGSTIRPTPEPCLACESCLEIRQGNAVDVIEIDAATNRGIDEIRELRDAARYQPSRDRFKIIILDEAHQITDAAFNALLKTLEEPPDHIVFMMATTEPENIPQTIRSRCQHFSFHAVKLDDIVGQLRGISTAENIDASDATLALLAEAGDGSMRDALSIMDQAIASAPMHDGRPVLEVEQVRELMGSVSNVVYEQVLEAIRDNSSADVIAIVARLLDAGNGASQIARQFVRFLRNCVVAKITGLTPGAEVTGAAADLLQISSEERSRCARSASLFSEEDLSRFLGIMLRTFDELGFRQEQRFHLELGLLKMVHVQRLIPVEDLLAQLGAPAPSGVTPTPSTGRAASSAVTAAVSAAPRPSAPTASASSTPARSAAPSPFDSDRSRKVPSASAAASSSPIAGTSTAGSLALAGKQDPVANDSPSSRPHLVATPPAPPEPARAAVVAPAAVTPLETPSPTFAPPIPSASAPVETMAATPIVAAPIAAPSFAASPVAASPFSATAIVAEPIVATAIEAEPITAAPAASTGGIDLEALQHAMGAALAAGKGQESASHQIEDATFTLNGDTVEIQTGVSKAMLPLLFNAEADKLLKSAMREQGHAALKFKLLPGTPAAAGKPKKARAAAAGSVEDLAAKHPIVQKARELFSAEIIRVDDLRKD
ncbi:DNA polymerase-3 subunit gamma/tau [Bryocella elongata]|uniref:DNA polymerase III subunit gamma/tau n=1 Tax=Bryocella elongata TaxID=863522 RepID=A0A1H5ZGX3_9BACT|nr:DNA polymerase III subunit gamma/tau [Bryocella elongata]SEG35492.1 DNA polymerase-3 subunit gamma/tau [Bryocella elongata]